MDDPVTHFFDTPTHHLLAIEHDTAAVIRMDRRAYHRSIFLDRRISALEPHPQAIPIQPLIEAAARVEPGRVCWIFHVAHCGSTLLARGLDQPSGSLVLREPPPLRQLGLARAGGSAPQDWDARVRLAHAAAARRFDPGLPTIVKANVPVNFMLDALSHGQPDHPAILLHFPLEPYLLAILRTPNHRTWVERLTMQTLPALTAATEMQIAASLPERAAALWLFQMIAFDHHLTVNPQARSLEASVLFANPCDIASITAAHFGLPDFTIGPDTARIASTYSKNPEQSFDEDARRARATADAERLAPEIAEARRWIERSKAAQALPAALPRPLAGDEIALLT
jgi:hypothetical protein